MLSIISFLTATKIGRYLAGGILIAGVISLVVLRVFLAGRAAERVRQDAVRLKTLQKRIKVDEEISGLSSVERRKRLDQWLHDD